MIIYKTTNLLNGKFYVGKDEKNNPYYLGSGKILKLAIKKYGIENFKKEIIETCKTIDELNEREKFWINVLSATTFGYNIAEGGTGGRTKFKKIYQFEKNGRLIKEWSSAAEVNRTLQIDQSSILKACKGELLSVNNFIWSYENEVKPFIDTRAIKVLQYDKNGNLIKEWCSIAEIKKEYSISDRHIQLTLDNPNKTAKGFIWIRKMDEIKDKIEVPKSKYFNNKNAKKKINYE
jgi:group I intron endonuclease